MVEFFLPGIVARPGSALLAYTSITDTNTHTYRNTNGIFLKKIGLNVPSAKGAAIWVYNAENQAATVQVIGNIAANQMYPDFSIGSSTTVDAGSADWIILSPPWFEFVSLQVSYATAPTTGYFYAILMVYY